MVVRPGPDMVLYRARFLGHKIALSSGTHDRLRPRCSGIARTTQAVLLDQPVGVVAGNEVAAGVTDLVDGLVARFMAKAIARSGPGCGSWVSGLRSAGCSGLWARMTCSPRPGSDRRAVLAATTGPSSQRRWTRCGGPT